MKKANNYDVDDGSEQFVDSNVMQKNKNGGEKKTKSKFECEKKQRI